MVELDLRSLSICIQALQKAIGHNTFIAQSETVDAEDLEESSYMYELELVRIAKIYRKAERKGEDCTPLSLILKPPFDDLLTDGHLD